MEREHDSTQICLPPATRADGAPRGIGAVLQRAKNVIDRLQSAQETQPKYQTRRTNPQAAPALSTAPVRRSTITDGSPPSWLTSINPPPLPAPAVDSDTSAAPANNLARRPTYPRGARFAQSWGKRDAVVAAVGVAGSPAGASSRSSSDVEKELRLARLLMVSSATNDAERASFHAIADEAEAQLFAAPSAQPAAHTIFPAASSASLVRCGPVRFSVPTDALSKWSADVDAEVELRKRGGLRVGDESEPAGNDDLALSLRDQDTATPAEERTSVGRAAAAVPSATATEPARVIEPQLTVEPIAAPIHPDAEVMVSESELSTPLPQSQPIPLALFQSDPRFDEDVDGAVRQLFEISNAPFFDDMSDAAAAVPPTPPTIQLEPAPAAALPLAEGDFSAPAPSYLDAPPPPQQQQQQQLVVSVPVDSGLSAPSALSHTDMPSAHFIVEFGIVSAAGLPSLRNGERPSAYATVQWHSSSHAGRVLFTTPVAVASCSPQWDYSFPLLVPGSSVDDSVSAGDPLRTSTLIPELRVCVYYHSIPFAGQSAVVPDLSVLDDDPSCVTAAVEERSNRSALPARASASAAAAVDSSTVLSASPILHLLTAWMRATSASSVHSSVNSSSSGILSMIPEPSSWLLKPLRPSPHDDALVGAVVVPLDMRVLQTRRAGTGWYDLAAAAAVVEAAPVGHGSGDIGNDSSSRIGRIQLSFKLVVPPRALPFSAEASSSINMLVAAERNSGSTAAAAEFSSGSSAAAAAASNTASLSSVDRAPETETLNRALTSASVATDVFATFPSLCDLSRVMEDLDGLQRRLTMQRSSSASVPQQLADSAATTADFSLQESTEFSVELSTFDVAPEPPVSGDNPTDAPAVIDTTTDSASATRILLLEPDAANSDDDGGSMLEPPRAAPAPPGVAESLMHTADAPFVASNVSSFVLTPMRARPSLFSGDAAQHLSSSDGCGGLALSFPSDAVASESESVGGKGLSEDGVGDATSALHTTSEAPVELSGASCGVDVVHKFNTSAALAATVSIARASPLPSLEQQIPPPAADAVESRDVSLACNDDDGDIMRSGGGMPLQTSAEPVIAVTYLLEESDGRDHSQSSVSPLTTPSSSSSTPSSPPYDMDAHGRVSDPAFSGPAVIDVESTVAHEGEADPALDALVNAFLRSSGLGIMQKPPPPQQQQRHMAMVQSVSNILAPPAHPFGRDDDDDDDDRLACAVVDTPAVIAATTTPSTSAAHPEPSLPCDADRVTFAAHAESSPKSDADRATSVALAESSLPCDAERAASAAHAESSPGAAVTASTAPLSLDSLVVVSDPTVDSRTPETALARETTGMRFPESEDALACESSAQQCAAQHAQPHDNPDFSDVNDWVLSTSRLIAASSGEEPNTTTTATVFALPQPHDESPLQEIGGDSRAASPANVQQPLPQSSSSSSSSTSVSVQPLAQSNSSSGSNPALSASSSTPMRTIPVEVAGLGVLFLPLFPSSATLQRAAYVTDGIPSSAPLHAAHTHRGAQQSPTMSGGGATGGSNVVETDAHSRVQRSAATAPLLAAAVGDDGGLDAHSQTLASLLDALLQPRAPGVSVSAPGRSSSNSSSSDVESGNEEEDDAEEAHRRATALSLLVRLLPLLTNTSNGRKGSRHGAPQRLRAPAGATDSARRDEEAGGRGAPSAASIGENPVAGAAVPSASSPLPPLQERAQLQSGESSRFSSARTTFDGVMTSVPQRAPLSALLSAAASRTTSTPAQLPSILQRRLPPLRPSVFMQHPRQSQCVHAEDTTTRPDSSVAAAGAVDGSDGWHHLASKASGRVTRPTPRPLSLFPDRLMAAPSALEFSPASLHRRSSQLLQSTSAASGEAQRSSTRVYHDAQLLQQLIAGRLPVAYNAPSQASPSTSATTSPTSSVEAISAPLQQSAAPASAAHLQSSSVSSGITGGDLAAHAASTTGTGQAPLPVVAGQEPSPAVAAGGQAPLPVGQEPALVVSAGRVDAAAPACESSVQQISGRIPAAAVAAVVGVSIADEQIVPGYSQTSSHSSGPVSASISAPYSLSGMSAVIPAAPPPSISQPPGPFPSAAPPFPSADGAAAETTSRPVAATVGQASRFPEAIPSGDLESLALAALRSRWR